MKERPYQNVSIRMDPELFERVKRIAEQEQRTVSGQVRYWIRRAIGREEIAEGRTGETEK